MFVKISDVFSNTPGARFESEGPNSGEKFRKEILIPKYLEAKKKSEKLVINLDDCYGFATSFLEEAFGGLVRELKEKDTLNNIEIISMDDATAETLIEKYVREAEEKL